jgi:DnaJ family protein A protein 2
MPSHGNPFVKGNLYVLFRVEFPSDGDLTAAMIRPLKMVLPRPCPKIDIDQESDEVVHLEKAAVSNFGKGGIQNHDSQHESDDDEGPGVQCQQS